MTGRTRSPAWGGASLLPGPRPDQSVKKTATTPVATPTTPVAAKSRLVRRSFDLPSANSGQSGGCPAQRSRTRSTPGLAFVSRPLQIETPSSTAVAPAPAYTTTGGSGFGFSGSAVGDGALEDADAVGWGGGGGGGLASGGASSLSDSEPPLVASTRAVFERSPDQPATSVRAPGSR